MVRDGAIDPKTLLHVVGPEAQCFVKDPQKYIFKTDEEISSMADEEFVRPYTDPVLRSRAQMRLLIAKLVDAQLITFRTCSLHGRCIHSD